MKKTLLLTAAAVAISTLTAFGAASSSGPVVTQTQKMAGVNAPFQYMPEKAKIAIVDSDFHSGPGLNFSFYGPVKTHKVEANDHGQIVALHAHMVAPGQIKPVLLEKTKSPMSMHDYRVDGTRRALTEAFNSDADVINMSFIIHVEKFYDKLKLSPNQSMNLLQVADFDYFHFRILAELFEQHPNKIAVIAIGNNDAEELSHRIKFSPEMNRIFKQYRNNIVFVGASDKNGNVTDYSVKPYKLRDLQDPFSRVLTAPAAFDETEYTSPVLYDQGHAKGGTSFAAPKVTAAIALLAANYNIPAKLAAQILLETADKKDRMTYGSGLMNVTAAAQAIEKMFNLNARSDRMQFLRGTEFAGERNALIASEEGRQALLTAQSIEAFEAGVYKIEFYRERMKREAAALEQAKLQAEPIQMAKLDETERNIATYHAILDAMKKEYLQGVSFERENYLRGEFNKHADRISGLRAIIEEASKLTTPSLIKRINEIITLRSGLIEKSNDFVALINNPFAVEQARHKARIEAARQQAEAAAREQADAAARQKEAAEAAAREQADAQGKLNEAVERVKNIFIGWEAQIKKQEAEAEEARQQAEADAVTQRLLERLKRLQAEAAAREQAEEAARQEVAEEAARQLAESKELLQRQMERLQEVARQQESVVARREAARESMRQFRGTKFPNLRSIRAN